ncbi:MAG: phosphotransferase enzyme family protein [Ktedonobacteraceae bacterium]
MMNLSTLCAVDSTVDTDGGSPIAEQILKQWDHEQGSAQFFRSSANFVYRFRKEGEPCFLRFAAATERTRDTIEAEIDILQWVARRGITVTSPLPSRSGNFVETVVTDLGTFHAVVFAGMEGTQLDIEYLNDSQFGEWGAALGKLHSAIQSYAGPALSTRSTWRGHLELIRAFLPEEKSAVRSEFEQVAFSLQALPVTHDACGLVHFDFELDNLYWQNQTIGIGDFDDCSYGWYIMDIAFALRDLFREGIDLNHKSFLAFIRGYRTQHGLHAELLSQVPLFLRMAKLLTYARLVRCMDLPPDAEDPAWLHSLCLKLENWLDDYKASLENHA